MLREKLHVVFIIVTIALAASFSSIAVGLTSSFVIKNSGLFESGLTAQSGSPHDIQVAVDAVAAAGGGTVYIPAGDFAFNPPAGGVGVTVPAGVHLVGAGKGKTILRETIECQESTMVKLNGMSQAYNLPNLQSLQKPSKVQGISFIGFVPSRADADSTTNNNGLSISCIKDFLVYDCEFVDFVNTGVYAANNMGWTVSAYIMRGVISHCSFDDPYKDNLAINGRIWGYGIIVGGTGYWAGTDAVRNLLGRYDDVNNVVYIENNTFKRNRHSIAASQAGYYVARYNYFEDMVQCFYTSFIDAHGNTKGFEIYNNTIVDFPADVRVTSVLSPPEQYYGRYMARGVGIRGGRGVIFNNDIRKCGNYGIGLTNDGGAAPDAPISETRTQDVFIWGNTFTDVPTPVTDDGSAVLNTDYFLRAPTLAHDGFMYTPYPYPHPLVASMIV